MAALDTERLTRIGHALYYERSLQRLGHAFAAAGLEPVVVKGQAVVDAVRSEPGERLASDIDLLALPDEQPAIERVLVQLGYREEPPPGRGITTRLLGERVFLSLRGAIPVELHSHFDKLILRQVDYHGICHRAVASPYAGLRYPAPEDLLLLVVLHAANWAALDETRVLDDLEGLVGQGDINLDVLRERASRWRLRVALETWLERLRQTRGLGPGGTPRFVRWTLCTWSRRLSEPLPLGLRSFAVLIPWHDSLLRPAVGMVRYAALRIAERAVGRLMR